MDKIKQILELLRKHHFWILCGLAALASLIAWSMSTGSLATQFQANVGQIEQKISSLSSPVEAHVDWKPTMDKETAVVWDNVNDTWKKLYNYQKEKVFIWPADLGPTFLQAIQKVDGTKDELQEDRLIHYQSAVRNLVKKLPAIIDAESAMDPQSAPAINPQLNPGGVPVGPDHRVVWQPTSQLEIYETFNWVKAQSTLIVRMAQEELWVYQALLNVIKETNEGSRGSSDAPVKELTILQIAYNAVEDPPSANLPRYSDTLAAVDSAGGAAPAPAGGDKVSKPNLRERGKDNSGGGDHSFSAPAAADAAGGNTDDKWKEYRYINLKGDPVRGTEVDAGTNEFNLMPFVMDLRMDSRSIDRLLVAFRNSVLPIEVQQVRINPTSTAGSAGGGGIYRPSGGGSDHGGGPGAPMAAGGGSSQGQERVVTVEIRGVVALVQPPKMPPIQTTPTDPGAPSETPAPTAPPTTPASAPAGQ